MSSSDRSTRTFTLRNKAFEIPYADAMPGGIPAFSFGVATPLTTVGQFQFYALGRLGYGAKEGTFEAKASSGAVVRERLRLHLVPVSGATRILYTIPGATFVNPTLIAGAGMFWVNQQGRSPGINQSFLIPYVFATPGITLFEGRNARDWFGVEARAES